MVASTTKHFNTAARLTERETSILMLVAEGVTSQEAADKLFISRRTVEYHLDQVYRKLSVTSRLQALQRAQALGLINISGASRS